MAKKKVIPTAPTSLIEETVTSQPIETAPKTPSLDTQICEYQATHPQPLYHLPKVASDLAIENRVTVALAWNRVFEGNLQLQTALVSE